MTTAFTPHSPYHAATRAAPPAPQLRMLGGVPDIVTAAWGSYQEAARTQGLLTDILTCGSIATLSDTAAQVSQRPLLPTESPTSGPSDSPPYKLGSRAF